MKQFLLRLMTGICCVTTIVPSFAQLHDRPDRAKIVFAYLQSPTSNDVRGARWHALTHVGWSFIEFNASGALSGATTFQNRDAEFKAGGVVANNGVKMIAVLANANFDETILDTVLRSPSLRSTLITNITNVVANPTSGCDGVNLDFEFTWDAITRDGMMIFIQDLNTSLKSLTPPRELSIYVNPTWNSTLYNGQILQDHTDYVIYSGYDFASGNGMTAIGRYGSPSSFSIIRNMDDYLASGISADHLVLGLPFYSRTWTTDAAGVYGDTGSAPVTSGLIKQNFDTMWRNPVLPKYFSNPANHQGVWYKQDQGGGVWSLTTFDDAQTLEAKLRLANVWPGNQSTGRQLLGVAFWSMLELDAKTSVDANNTGSGNQSLTRTINFPYRLMEELFAPPGEREFRVDTFEHLGSASNTGYNIRWRDPEDGPDDVNINAASSTRTPVAAPVGAPAGSKRVLAVSFRFDAAPGKFFFKHQPLMGTDTPYSVDWNGAIAETDSTTKFFADIHVPAGYAGTSIRMVVRDSLNQLEKGPAFNLTTPGWRRISFDLANDSITPYATSEGGYVTGNGVINSSGAGALDIAFAGFEVATTGFVGATGTVNFDKITYTDAQPGNRRYMINEFRYADASKQFVEIYGPAGTLPAGLVLRVVDGTTGNLSTQIAVSGSIPNDTGTGFGYYVVGSAGVPNVDQVISSGMLETGSPDAIQLFESPTGTIHDAVVYETFNGLGTVDGPGEPVVAGNGPGWLGDVATGTNSAGQAYTMGRYPDGSNTWINGNDFSIMPATSGSHNGDSIALPAIMNFSTVPSQPFQTFQTFSTSNPVAAGLPASPDNSVPGNTQAHRAADISGGGIMSVFGDASLGSIMPGHVRGYVYVPTAAANHQAIGLGIAVRSGSTFFSAFPAGSGFDSGYWLVYENRSGVAIADGQPDHPGVWHFLHATNDGRTAMISSLLAQSTNATLAVTPGQWAEFHLSINRFASPGDQLVASINNIEIYRGPFPTDGPTSGAFAVGFRETNGGTETNDEGTWVDGLEFTATGTPSVVAQWELY